MFIWYLGLCFMFFIGLLIIKISKHFVDWTFRWSVPLNNKINKPFKTSQPNVEGQRELAIWMCRIFGGLICAGSLAMLISGTINIYFK
jgi:hypothetical protein